MSQPLWRQTFPDPLVMSISVFSEMDTLCTKCFQMYTKTPVMIEHIATKHDFLFFFLHSLISIVDIGDAVLAVALQVRPFFVNDTLC